MKYLQALIFSTLLVVTTAYAGSGHDHGDSHSHKESSDHADSHGHDGSHGHSHGSIDKQAAVEKAAMKVKELVDSGKIDKSWSAIKVASAEQVTLKSGPEWLLTFNNNGISDKSKRKLYIFYTLDGRYLAANYSGK